MLDVIIEEYAIRIGQRFAVSFHRTLRIPDDGRTILCLPVSVCSQGQSWGRVLNLELLILMR